MSRISIETNHAFLQQLQLIVIDEEGPDSGRALKSNNGQIIRVATWADEDRFEKLFLDTLNTRLP